MTLPATDAPFTTDPSAISTSELCESFRRLVLLYDLGRQIVAETDDSRVFETILAAVAELLDVERAFIAVVTDGGLLPQATYHIDISGEEDTWPVSGTMLRRVLDEGVSLLTTDALHDALYGKARSVDKYSIRSVVCCPFGKRDAPKGLIYADNRLSSGAFSRADLEFLMALSHYAFLAISNAEERRRITREKEVAEARYETLRGEMAASHNIVAVSRDLIRLYGRAKRAARGNMPVLILGETGTGKELFARLIHTCSPRSHGPFVSVHVGALPGTMVESELFGHERGAFTGAERRRIGRFELAHGGTLFLDEILDIPLDIQPKLLRVLEEKTFERLGSNDTIRVDVRIVCACNRDPVKMVAEGLFREDLFYRLEGVTFQIPPLRDRREDIVPLVRHFLKQRDSKKAFDDEATASLLGYPWPGNVRELSRLVEALDALVDGPVIRKSDLPDRVRGSGTRHAAGAREFESLSEMVARAEEEHFRRAWEFAGGKNELAIELLGVSRDKFFRRKKLYGLK